MKKKKVKQIKRYTTLGLSLSVIGLFIVLAILQENGRI